MSQRGFTLIEMMIVIVIIGILVGIAVFGNRSAIPAAKEVALESDLRRLLPEQEIYLQENGKYANDPTKLDFQSSQGVTIKLKGNANGWSARALPQNTKTTKTCAVYVGSISPYKEAKNVGEGIINCQ